MYTKTINGRQVFDTCKTIQTNDGVWISNPTEEQILAAGWVLYIPPEVPVLPQTEPDYDQIINAVKKVLSKDTESLTDEEALEVAALYPTWVSKIGETVAVGERFWYDGNLYKVIQGHTVQENWTPDTSASLYAVVSIEEFPEWIQPIGAETAYNTGDKVAHNGLHYISTVNANVWEPGVYGWDEI